MGEKRIRTKAEEVLCSGAIGVLFVIGGFMLFFTLFLTYGAYFVYVSKQSFPANSASAIGKAGLFCVIPYFLGGFLWIARRRKSLSVDLNGRLLFSGSLFFVGALLLLVVWYFSTRSWELEGSVKSSYTLMNASFGCIALILIGTAGVVWRIARRRKREKPGVCPNCDLYLPEDLDVCPYCGAQIK